jgi:hypothetical protein
MRGFIRLILAREVDVARAPVVGGPQRYYGVSHGPSRSEYDTLDARKRVRLAPSYWPARLTAILSSRPSISVGSPPAPSYESDVARVSPAT